MGPTPGFFKRSLGELNIWLKAQPLEPDPGLYPVLAIGS